MPPKRKPLVRRRSSSPDGVAVQNIKTNHTSLEERQEKLAAAIKKLQELNLLGTKSKRSKCCCGGIICGGKTRGKRQSPKDGNDSFSDSCSCSDCTNLCSCSDCADNDGEDSVSCSCSDCCSGSDSSSDSSEEDEDEENCVSRNAQRARKPKENLRDVKKESVKKSIVKKKKPIK